MAESSLNVILQKIHCNNCEGCGRRTHGESLIFHLLETWKASIAVSGITLSYLYLHVPV